MLKNFSGDLRYFESFRTFWMLKDFTGELKGFSVALRDFLDALNIFLGS